MLNYMPGICLRSGNGRVGFTPRNFTAKPGILPYFLPRTVDNTTLWGSVRAMLLRFQ